MKNVSFNTCILLVVFIFSNKINTFGQSVIFDFKNKTFSKEKSCFLLKDKSLKIKIININLLKYKVEIKVDTISYKSNNPIKISDIEQSYFSRNDKSFTGIESKNYCDSLKNFSSDTLMFKNIMKYYVDKLYNVNTIRDIKEIDNIISIIDTHLSSIVHCDNKNLAGEIQQDLLRYKSSFEVVKSSYEYNIEVPNDIGDRFEITIKCIPRVAEMNFVNFTAILDSVTARKYLYPKKWSFSLSAGYSFDRLKNKSYSWKDETPDGTLVENIDSLGVYSISEENNSSRYPSIVSFGHVLYAFTPNFSFGAYFGIGSHIDEFSVDFHYGLTIALLKNRRVLLNIGRTHGLRTTGLTKELNTNNTYNYTSKEKYDLTNKSNLIKSWTTGVCTVGVTFQIF